MGIPVLNSYKFFVEEVLLSIVSLTPFSIFLVVLLASNCSTLPLRYKRQYRAPFLHVDYTSLDSGLAVVPDATCMAFLQGSQDGNTQKREETISPNHTLVSLQVCLSSPVILMTN